MVRFRERAGGCFKERVVRFRERVVRFREHRRRLFQGARLFVSGSAGPRGALFQGAPPHPAPPRPGGRNPNTKFTRAACPLPTLPGGAATRGCASHACGPSWVEALRVFQYRGASAPPASPDLAPDADWASVREQRSS